MTKNLHNLLIHVNDYQCSDRGLQSSKNPSTRLHAPDHAEDVNWSYCFGFIAFLVTESAWVVVNFNCVDGAYMLYRREQMIWIKN